MKNDWHVMVSSVHEMFSSLSPRLLYITELQRVTVGWRIKGGDLQVLIFIEVEERILEKGKTGGKGTEGSGRQCEGGGGSCGDWVH